jgi:serine protease Do
MKKVNLMLSFVLLLITACFNHTVYSTQVPRHARAMYQTEPDIASLVNEVSPAVVDIYTDCLGINIGEVKNFSRGTGVFVSADGKILTSSHVTDNACDIFVYPWIINEKGTRIKQRDVIRMVKDVEFPRSDLTILKPKKSYKPDKFIAVNPADADLIEGEIVIYFGRTSIFGQALVVNKTELIERKQNGETHNTPSFSFGISAEPGDSGGPVFNMRGQLVGIISATTINKEQPRTFASLLTPVRTILYLTNR